MSDPTKYVPPEAIIHVTRAEDGTLTLMVNGRGHLSQTGGWRTYDAALTYATDVLTGRRPT